MDTLAHGLWAAAIYEILNLKAKQRFSVLEAFVFGIFPDIFTFTIPFFAMILSLISGTGSSGITHNLFSESSTLFNFTHFLYGATHSLLIFLFVFLLVCLILSKPIWVMGGWLLHIIIDIPSHSGDWATPYLWPFKTPFLDGFAWWHNSWIVIANYIILLALYAYIIIEIRRNNSKKLLNI